MKVIVLTCLVAIVSCQAIGQPSTGSAEDLKSLEKETTALRAAFAKGDAKLVASLHHPDIVKYFGGKNVVTGRAMLEKGLADWFSTTTVEFMDNIVESTVFNGNTAIQTSIFSIKTTHKAGGEPTRGRGRAMVIYVRDKDSPTGWLSLREMAQEAPPKESAL